MKRRKLFCAYSLLFFLIVCDSLSAQVPVREEPHHKVVLENDYVRLIDVHIPAHDTTLAHIHAAPSVIVFLSASTIGTQIVGENSVISKVVPAQTGYAAYDEKSITHRVWNDGNSLFHVMDIELVKKNPADDSCAILSQKGMALQRVQKLVRTYKITLQKGNSLQLPKSACAYLLIDITGSTTASSAGKTHQLKSGKFVFSYPQTAVNISGNHSDAECVLLELK
jgi:hypothetical protein